MSSSISINLPDVTFRVVLFQLHSPPLNISPFKITSFYFTSGLPFWFPFCLLVVSVSMVSTELQLNIICHHFCRNRLRLYKIGLTIELQNVNKQIQKKHVGERRKFGSRFCKRRSKTIMNTGVHMTKKEIMRIKRVRKSL